VAAGFDQQADQIRKLLASVRQQQEQLQNGDWVGTGAQAFYAEMNSTVVPTLNRLLQAMSQAATTTRQINQSMQQTEAEAASFFRLNGNGAAAGGLASVGAALSGALGNASGIAAELGAIQAGNGGGVSAGPVVGEGMKSFVGKMAGPAAKAPKPPPHPGVDMFGGESNPIPDPTGVRPYDRTPNLQGEGYTVGGGHSTTVARWAGRFKQVGPMIEAQRQMLAKLKDQFSATMKKHQARVIAASKNMAANLMKLNTATDGQAFRLIKEFQQFGRQAQIADVNAHEAFKLADAALEDNKAAKQAIEIHTKRAAEKSLSEKKAAIEARIAKRKEIIGKIVGLGTAATGGAAGVTAKLTELSGEMATEVISMMLTTETGQLAVLDAQIEALNEQIATAEDDKLKAELQSTKNRLEASFDKVVAAKLQARANEMAQMDTLDQLAALEEGNKTGTMFQELRDYNSEVMKTGNELRARSQDYITALEKTPGVGDAGSIAARVADDIRTDQIYGRNNRDWQFDAAGTQRYLEQVEAWRRGEIKAHNDLNVAIGRGGHGNFTDGVILAADEALKGTAVKRQTVRQPAR
jgi:WXG100 family type VII secretion target